MGKGRSAPAHPGQTWVPVPPASDFPLANLPYGVFTRPGQAPRLGVAIGAHVLDLSVLAAEGLLDDAVEGARVACAAPALNPFLERGRPAWTALRTRLLELLAEPSREIRDRPGLAERVLVPQVEVTLGLPFVVADYVDFFSSLEHATNLGRILRPGTDPLQPNWRHLPVGYHGRSGTIVPSGTPIVRPRGQLGPPPAGEARAAFGPTRCLDLEVEVGFVTGPVTTPTLAERAEEHIFGFVLVNDWSARDLQAWEYRPLGPFLGKSFATSVSPWVVPLEALTPYRCPGPPQHPPVLDHLVVSGDRAIDLHLEATLSTHAMCAEGTAPFVLCRTNLRHLYWTPAQQLAHVTSNGATVRAGDLYASGTVSGPGPSSVGSLIERTWNGERPLSLPGGETRTFLVDGDTVTVRGWCGGDGRPRIGFGAVSGTVTAGCMSACKSYYKS
ncbi:MAG: fumarylacetoacetase [Egibacteraceae bacterium]